MRALRHAWLALVAAAVMSTAASAQQQAAQREITQVAGDLYRFLNTFTSRSSLVTPEGVIATDPINADAAAWLKDQIKERFDRPIRYVIYSHDHADHIAGRAGLLEQARAQRASGASPPGPGARPPDATRR